MPEIFVKMNPDHPQGQDEATFRVLLWALGRVENQDARKLLIKAVALLASDD